MEEPDLMEPRAESWAATRQYGLMAAVAAFVALALLANSYRVDSRERAAQRDAEAHGVIVPAQGIKRMTSVFANRPLTQGTAVRVAWDPTDPARIYIVGASPWTWWAAMRPLFVTMAVLAVVVALVALVFDLGLRGGRSSGGKLGE